MGSITRRIADAKQLGNFAETYEKSNPLLAKVLYTIAGSMVDGDFDTIAALMSQYAKRKV